MSSTYRQRYIYQPKQNDLKVTIPGEVHLLQVCLDYKGSQSPLNCTIDGLRLLQRAQKSGITDIVSIYDDLSTQLFPSKQTVRNQLIQMCQKCKSGDYFVFQFSGHGASVPDQDGDQQDGMDQALCLINQNGQSQYLIDDQISEIISKQLNPKTVCLLLVDACHSGTILDTTKKGLWKGGRRIFCISGCQDSQCSIDTGNGGQMTNSLLQTLANIDKQFKQINKCKKKSQFSNKQYIKGSKFPGRSLQYVFNRMVQKMPQQQQQQNQQQQIQGQQGYQQQQEAYWQEDDWQQGYQNNQQEVIDDVKPGQWLNLSWCGGVDPTSIPFPF